MADTLASAGFGPEVVAAALLHDAVEHTDVEPGELEDEFGECVADLVAAMTDREDIEPWEARKDEHRARVAAAGRDAAAIYAADKLEGVLEARSGYADVGEAVEERLGTPLDTRFTVWKADLEMLGELDPPLPFPERIEEELRLLAADRQGDRRIAAP